MHHFLWRGGIIAALMASSAFSTVCAADAPQTKLPADLTTRRITINAEGRSLPDYIADLAKQIRRGIVADSLPLKKEADIRVEGTAQEALDKVADTFDYSWAVGRHGVILFSKRYKNPDELPQLNAAELREAARAGISVLDSLGIDQTPGQMLLNRLFATFTPEQVASLQSGQSLKATALTGLQMSLLQQAISVNATNHLYQLWQGWNRFFDQEWPLLSEMQFETENTHRSLPDPFTPGKIRELDTFQFYCAYPGFDGRESRYQLMSETKTKVR